MKKTIQTKFMLSLLPALLVISGCGKQEDKASQDLKVFNSPATTKTKNILSFEKTRFDIAKEKADHGDKTSAALIGYFYLDGTDVERDPVKGLEILNKQAEEKNHTAYAILWSIYLQGDLVEANPKIAMKWLKKLVDEVSDKEQNLYIFSRISYAFAYGNGVGVPVDEKKAEQYFKEALSQEYSATWFNHNASYYMTYDNKLHPTKALKLLTLANACSPNDIMTPVLTKDIEKNLPSDPARLKETLEKVNNKDILNPNTSLMAMSWFFLNPVALTQIENSNVTECVVVEGPSHKGHNTNY